MQRREFLERAGAVAGAAVAGSSASASPTAVHVPKGKAEHVVFLWLGGGMAQIDTFDPKEIGDPKAKKAGSYYPAIDTAVPGVQVCEHLSHTAAMMEHVTALRTVNHNVVDEHAAATNRMHTGRPTSGTVQYPSIGSIVAHERGSAAEGVPAYMLIGYPNPSRGPGFLGQKAGFVYLTDLDSGPAGLSRPADLNAGRIARREELLSTVRATGRDRFAGDHLFQEYDAAIAENLRLSGPEFMKVFDLTTESDDLRNAYGGEFGQRCLLARRLVQAGVRFIEVSHNLNFINGTGWDTHNEGQQNQHLLIRELDIALSALITDLEQQGLLDTTLIALGTEFGRPATYDGRGGRGHQGSCFSLLLAGGGLKHHGAWGVTDELSKTIVENPVSVPDFHATIHAALGIDPAHELFDGSRPVPITDQGRPVEALFG
ncbi:MAG: DUF1501 domain-containing protein [Planctomycetaceae bacterium]|nr:DUF1501 domain-containing protein [Planctomycetaceae bacterium]